METDALCGSCKKKITNTPGTAQYLCPNCGKTQIIRCKHCREISAKYVCAECGFTGPN